MERTLNVDSEDLGSEVCHSCLFCASGSLFLSEVGNRSISEIRAGRFSWLRLSVALCRHSPLAW